MQQLWETIASYFQGLCAGNCKGPFIFFCFVLWNSTTHAQLSNVKGKVKSGGKALASATISIADKQTITDAAGDFSVQIIAGKYKLAITHIGYQNIEQQINLHEGETLSLQFEMMLEDQLNDAVVLGSRSSVHRSIMNTPVPVDVVLGSTLPTGETVITRQLANLVPAFNAAIQTLSIASVTNPARLRGLAPDQTLVLLNGRRRHTTALTFPDGSVCTELNAIPSAAIEKIEVLRDGAAAQYGSDAIAGVISFHLKKSTDKTYINLHLGQFYKGDGQSVLFEINRGFQLTKKGFVNLTAVFAYSSPTQRNGVYDSTVYYHIPATGVSDRYRDSIRELDNKMVAERGFDRLNFRRIGNSEILNGSFVMNGGYRLNKKANLYWTGTMNYRNGDDRTNPVYRYPKDTTTVNTILFPDGFQPHVKSSSINYSIIAGIAGRTNNGWHWDLGSVYGINHTSITVFNSNNASQFEMGKNAPTTFDYGNLSFGQLTNSLNFTRNFAKNIPEIKSLTTSFGAEFRVENYKTIAGEEASWKNYAPASGRLGGSSPPGIAPENEVSKNRYITAAYAELDMDINEKLLLNIAGRYEYYSDFGGNLAGKLALRYKLTNRLIWRGSFSNGFRAPALQQRYFSATNYSGGRNVFGISVTGTYRNDSDVAEAFGISSLQAEKSFNAGTGITLKISERINLTLDAYWIQLSNQIFLTGSIQRNAAVPRVGAILDSLNRREVMAVRFYTNAISTRTKGIDLVLTGKWPIRKSMLEITVAGNYNKTTIYQVGHPAKNLPNDSVYLYTLVNPEDRGRIEQSNPREKLILAVNYKTGKWQFGVRSIYNGSVAHIFFGSNRSRDQFFSPRTISFFNVNYSPKKWVNIGLGANNVFNVYPDKINHRQNSQGGLLIYDGNYTQIGFNGGYYFLNMVFSW